MMAHRNRMHGLVQLVSEMIAGCNQCSRHRGQASLDEICHRLHLTKSQTKRVIRELVCPGCEASPSLYKTVAEWEPSEWADILKSKRWVARYAGSIRSLAKHIERTPSLALLHPAAKDLTRAVKRATVSTIEEPEWWRACCADQASVPTAERFLPADPHAFNISPGRFNHATQTAYYAARNPETAAIEVLREPKGSVWIARLAFSRSLRLIDLRIRLLGATSLQGLLLTGINFSEPRDEDDKAPRAWLITRLCADLVRTRPRVDGIIYTSSLRPPVSDNIVLVRRVPVKVSSSPEKYTFEWDNLDFRFNLRKIQPFT